MQVRDLGREEEAEAEAEENGEKDVDVDADEAEREGRGIVSGELAMADLAARGESKTAMVFLGAVGLVFVLSYWRLVLLVLV